MSNIVYYDSLGWDDAAPGENPEPNPEAVKEVHFAPPPLVKHRKRDHEPSFHYMEHAFSTVLYILLIFLVMCSLMRCVKSK
jgi:hypothetical protein